MSAGDPIKCCPLCGGHYYVANGHNCKFQESWYSDPNKSYFKIEESKRMIVFQNTVIHLLEKILERLSDERS